MPLIHKGTVRYFVLDHARKVRPGSRLSRVDSTVYEAAERHLSRYLERLVETHPSSRKTISAPLAEAGIAAGAHRAGRR